MQGKISCIQSSLEIPLLSLELHADSFLMNKQILSGRERNVAVPPIKLKEGYKEI